MRFRAEQPEIALLSLKQAEQIHADYTGSFMVRGLSLWFRERRNPRCRLGNLLIVEAGSEGWAALSISARVATDQRSSRVRPAP